MARNLQTAHSVALLECQIKEYTCQLLRSQGKGISMLNV